MASAQADLMHPVVFFGTEKFSLFGLRALIDAGYPIAAVVTKPDMKKGRGHTLVSPDVKLLADAHNIPVLQPVKLTEITDFITSLQPVVGVLVSFGRILPQSIIDLFQPGIINVHPSLLPIYRGPSPIETAILNNDRTTGVSIMQLSAQMDAGPVYTQQSINLNTYRKNTGNDFTKEALYTTLGHLGAELLVKSLPGILSGALPASPQDDTAATYCQLIKKQDGAIDWRKDATRLANEVIAYAGWPGSSTVLRAVEVTVAKAYPLIVNTDGPLGDALDTPQQPHEPGTILVNTIFSQNAHTPLPLVIASGADANGAPTYLHITRLKPAGKKELSDREFINGYGQLFS